MATATKKQGVIWLKKNFGTKIDAAVAGTPFSRNLICAIAMQETSYIWRRVIDTKTTAEVLALCVGDVIDAPSRTAFPETRAKLEAFVQGKEMFAVARKALETIAEIDAGYKKAFNNPDKFCRGYGMFQYDLQFFKDNVENRAYFLKKKWAKFDGTLEKCISELEAKLEKVYGPGKTTLNRNEGVYVAIAYNKGSADISKDFKQGHKDKSGKYYGEYIDEFLTLAGTVPD